MHDIVCCLLFLVRETPFDKGRVRGILPAGVRLVLQAGRDRRRRPRHCRSWRRQNWTAWSVSSLAAITLWANFWDGWPPRPPTHVQSDVILNRWIQQNFESLFSAPRLFCTHLYAVAQIWFGLAVLTLVLDSVAVCLVGLLRHGTVGDPIASLPAEEAELPPGSGAHDLSSLQRTVCLQTDPFNFQCSFLRHLCHLHRVLSLRRLEQTLLIPAETWLCNVCSLLVT